MNTQSAINHKIRNVANIMWMEDDTLNSFYYQSDEFKSNVLINICLNDSLLFHEFRSEWDCLYNRMKEHDFSRTMDNI